MKLEIIRETLKNKSLKKEFALITNLINGESEIFFPGHDLSEMFSKYSEEIEKIFKLNKKSKIIKFRKTIIVLTAKKPSEPSVKLVMFKIYTHIHKHIKIEIFIGRFIS